MTNNEDVLAQPDAPQTVRDHHFAVVTKLNDAGYQWRGANDDDTAMIEEFVRAHGQAPADWKLDRQQSAVIAQTSDETPVSICVIGAMAFSGKNCVLIQHLVTDPAHADLGIETVSLNILHQILPDNFHPECCAGTLSPDEAPLYAASGYTVLEPYAPFTWPGTTTPIVTPNPQSPCWAYKMN